MVGFLNLGEHAPHANLGMTIGPTALELIEDDDGSSKVENQVQPSHADTLKERF